MSLYVTIRRALTTAPAAALLAALCISAVAQQNNAGQRPAPRMAPPPQHSPGMYPGQSPHLQQWMESHRSLTPEQQQRALSREPGFRDLPPETQQRMRDRLTQLNNMPPERRQRLLEHNEAIARLAPEQRQQFRSAMDQFKGLPPDRRREVARAFRELRQTPEPQRQSMLNSGRYRQFSDQERNALSNLLTVEPYLPLRRPGNTPE
ncbi:MAG TPA: DUF3106 domain-containing protein [Edaphobacter sp.]